MKKDHEILVKISVQKIVKYTIGISEPQENNQSLIVIHHIRLKGITCGNTTEAPPRKRSNSLPLPKIEVTTCGSSSGDYSAAAAGGNEAATASADQKKAACISLGSDLSSDHTSVGVKRRSSTISGGRSGDFTKKSVTNLGLGGDVNRFQSFKKLVQTKILSKSDRSLVELQPAIGKKQPHR